MAPGSTTMQMRIQVMADLLALLIDKSPEQIQDMYSAEDQDYVME